MAPPGREKAGEAALSAMCSARQLPALSRRVFFSQLAISLSQRSRDSFRGSCSSRRALSSRLAGGDAQCQCSSFFTASQPARAAQPAAIGRTRPQPAGTRFPTRSFRQPARGSLDALEAVYGASGYSDIFVQSVACCVRMYHVQMYLFHYACTYVGAVCAERRRLECPTWQRGPGHAYRLDSRVYAIERLRRNCYMCVALVARLVWMAF